MAELETAVGYLYEDTCDVAFTFCLPFNTAFRPPPSTHSGTTRPNRQHRCNGEKPCTRCANKNIQCEYTFKKRCGPKRRKGMPSDGGGLLAPYPDADGGGGGGGGGKVLGFGDHLRGESTALNTDEVECVDVFMQNINTFLPLTTFDTIKRAAKATAHRDDGGGDASGTGSEEDSSGGGLLEPPYEDRNQMHHARKAMLHGAIALGAEFLDKDEESVKNAAIARQEIKEW